MSDRADEAARLKDEQRRQWNGVAAGWKRWWPTIEHGAHGVSARLLELADVRPGHRVLDIATGIGEPALLAAVRVGPAGRVVATDLAPRMLDIARERAQASGLGNVEFLEGDAEQMAFRDGSFDAVLWRWGPSDLPQPADTLAAIRRMLTPHGRFAAAVWKAGPQARPLASLATSVAEEVFGVPSAGAGEPFPPADALEKALIDAGFSEVRVEELTMSLTFASTDDCTRYLMDVSPTFAALLSGKPSAEQAKFRDGLAGKLRRFVVSDGSVRIPNVTLCAAGRR